MGQAIAAWQDFEGELWWHLIVRMDDGSFRAARFNVFLDSLEARGGSADTPVSTLSDLTPVPVVAGDAIDTNEAKALARKTAAHVVVVTSAGLPAGILVEGVRRGAGLIATGANLDELGGKYVKLKDYGSILLAPVKKPLQTPR